MRVVLSTSVFAAQKRTPKVGSFSPDACTETAACHSIERPSQLSSCGA